MNKSIYLIFVFFVCLLVVKGVEGAECNLGLVEDCTVSSSMTLPYGIYNLNDTNGNGAIRLTTANIILDCNYSIIYGLFTNITASTGFSVSANNVTLKNCNVNGGYKYGYLNSYRKTGFNISNSNFTGNYTTNTILIDDSVNGVIERSFFNATVKTTIGMTTGRGNNILNNNIFMGYNNNPLLSLSGTNLNITNNKFYNSTGQFAIDFLTLNNSIFSGNIVDNTTLMLRNGATYNTISNNIFRNKADSTYSLINVVGNSNNNVVINNSFSNFYYWLLFQSSSNNVFSNNTIYNCTSYECISLLNASSMTMSGNNYSIGAKALLIDQGSNNINITNTIIDSFYNNFDNWNVGVWIAHNSSNIIFDNVSITKVSFGGILIQGANNVTIKNSYCNVLNASEKIRLNSYDFGESAGCYNIVQQYGGWTGDYLDWTWNVSMFSNYSSSNIVLANLTYGNDVQVYVRLQNASSVTSPYTNYDSGTNWYRKIALNLNQTNPYELFINPSVTKLTRVTDFNYPSVMSYNGNESEVLYQTLANPFRRYFNYSISKTQINIINVATNYSFLGAPYNQTFLFTPSSYNVSIYSAQSYFPNNDLRNSSNGVILLSNFDNFTGTIGPNVGWEVTNYGSKVFAPNILSIFDINSNNYFDRIVKGVYGNIPRLPDNQNGFQSSFLITPSTVNQTMNVTILTSAQINAYSNNANITAIVPGTMKVCYSSIYGGPIACITNYTYTLT